ncbi:MAG: hypothetical protein JWQ78_1074 [Sediminibacterium sp.]|nr:hypothetical protein [Sediminibacterium sp.]
MRKRTRYLLLVILAVFNTPLVQAQCSICTKTASQLGNGPASALNSAILYLAAAPFAVMGYIGWRWWKNEKALDQRNDRK